MTFWIRVLSRLGGCSQDPSPAGADTPGVEVPTWKLPGLALPAVGMSATGHCCGQNLCRLQAPLINAAPPPARLSSQAFWSRPQAASRVVSCIGAAARRVLGGYLYALPPHNLLEHVSCGSLVLQPHFLGVGRGRWWLEDSVSHWLSLPGAWAAPQRPTGRYKFSEAQEAGPEPPRS